MDGTIMNKMSLKLAVNTTLSILFMVAVFHLLVLVNVVPYTIVWGGKFHNETQLRNFEVVSIAINAFMIFVVAIKGQYINLPIPMKVISTLMWLFVLLFAFNTIGNLFAKTALETIVFSPITFILALLCFRIAKG